MRIAVQRAVYTVLGRVACRAIPSGSRTLREVLRESHAPHDPAPGCRDPVLLLAVGVQLGSVALLPLGLAAFAGAFLLGDGGLKLR